MKFKYRPEIDGLRAIAVLSVVIYHAGFKIEIFESNNLLLPGGFLGVDIFYVISGYLITFLILEQQQKKKFLFSEFYERRARRLLPALFVVIISTLISGWFLMLPNQLEELAGSALSSLFFVSNFWFYEIDSYFAESLSFKPLLHTWSLSIEEQFYLIFPPVIYLLFKKKLFKLNSFFIFLIISSLISSTFFSLNYTNLNFYILPSRIWELMVGSLIANLHFTKNSINIEKKINSDLLALLGIILIFVPFFLFNEKTPHPSIITIFTILGTSIIILDIKRENFVKKLLSSRLLVGIGLISYSLYLWHFPILAFKKIKSSNLSEFDKFEGIILAIIISIFSYLFIEKPFRNKLVVKKYLFFFSISTVFLIILFSSLYIYKKNGVPNRYSKTILKLVEFNYDYTEAYQKGKCHIEKKESLKKDLFQNCNINISKEKKDIFLWGDSLAAHLYPGLKHKYSSKYNIWQRSVDTCKPTIFTLQEKNKKNSCEFVNDLVIKEIIEIQPEKIFISGGWAENDLQKIQKLIDIIGTKSKSKIYLVGPSIRWQDPLPKILLKKYKISKKIPKFLSDKNHKKNFDLDDKFSSFSKMNQIYYISPIKILCNNKYQCLTKVGDEADSITTWDENHFTEKTSQFIFSKFID